MEISFKELIKHVCSRPGMYTPKGTFGEVYSLIFGYSLGNKNTPISGDNGKIFGNYVCLKFGFQTKYTTNYVFEICTDNDDEAIKLLEETINEFDSLRKRMTSNEILDYAATNFKYEDGEPEKIFRIFDEALLNGEEKVIKPLIEEHEHQSILWKSAYPKEVGKLLKQISEGQPIKRIYESEDKTRIKLLSADFPFPIEMSLKDGNWKINASRLINLRMSQGKNEK